MKKRIKAWVEEKMKEKCPKCKSRDHELVAPKAILSKSRCKKCGEKW